jgi:hypothetical protein
MNEIFGKIHSNTEGIINPIFPFQLHHLLIKLINQLFIDNKTQTSVMK